MLKEKETPMDEIINKLIPGAKNNGIPINTNNISDGYHTFGELYEHRITLYITMLSRMDASKDIFGDPMYKDLIWKSKAHSDGSVWDGWFILGIFKNPGEQITYHLPMDKWDSCYFAGELEKAPEWDGHTSNDVLERLKKL